MYNHCYQQTENDHAGKRKIKTKAPFFNSNITRQTADPVQFIMKEINDNTCQQDKHSDDNDPFSGIAVHAAKIGLNRKYCYKPVKQGILRIIKSGAAEKITGLLKTG
jgi:hypothetical protein